MATTRRKEKEDETNYSDHQAFQTRLRTRSPIVAGRVGYDRIRGEGVWSSKRAN